jgi:rhamnose utilization protein RhaD (predicted bifunctional aldolase and dehydrogenase)/NAD(P)-dependent dehydrogenase (short-subunit alcohol dehydrogenase family)
MQSRYVEAEAARVVADLRERTGASELLALRTYTARLLGAESSLVLHGGGNTSVKAQAKTLLGETIDVLHVKGSGWDLATIEPAGHPAVRLAPLLAYRALGAMSDEDMVNELRLNLLDASAPTPSVETLLHAYLPARFIDHTHADAVLTLADQPDGEKLCREVFGASMVWVPYVMPGFLLAKRCADAFDKASASSKTASKKPSVIVLQRHGIFTLGSTAKESYERMIRAVTKAEQAIGDRHRTVSLPASSYDLARATDRARSVLPRLRGALARLAGEPPERGPILELRTSETVRMFLGRPDAFDLAQIGCATPDHVLRTKPTALVLREPRYDDMTALDAALERDITAYARAYDAYFAKMCAEKSVTRTKLDPWPRVILLPGLGLCSVGKTRKEASIAADVYEHTIDVMTNAAGIGTYAPVSRSDLFDVEYWSLEQAKLKKGTDAPLAGRIALVTGAASGIGRATARRLVELGAHVVLVDRNAVELEVAHAELGRGRASQVTRCDADVTSGPDVERAIAHAVTTFGGLDLVVSNAGRAPEGRLDTPAGEEALRQSLDLNLLAHNQVARAAAEVMIAQGRGGCLLFNASKSAFNQGPGFGPYAVAKAALVALARQYAIDLGPSGIRSNAVNADRIRTALFDGGVVESRAQARGLSVEDYFRANLLGREVTADDVAGAFAYLAQARATTGCVVTVDGGNAAAFPR